MKTKAPLEEAKVKSFLEKKGYELTSDFGITWHVKGQDFSAQDKADLQEFLQQDELAIEWIGQQSFVIKQ
ncbi:hypothetical protein [Persicobacter psychrovividus]